MKTIKTYKYTDSEGDVNTFQHITDTCRCACYHGCYHDTLVAKELDEEDCIENIKLEFMTGKWLIYDMIDMLLDSGKIEEVNDG